MTGWSMGEVRRTLEEVRRRSVLDCEFRELTLRLPLAAIARVNPRPLPKDSVRFIGTDDKAEEIYSPNLIVMRLPSKEEDIGEISDEELKSVAGGVAMNRPDDPLRRR